MKTIKLNKTDFFYIYWAIDILRNELAKTKQDGKDLKKLFKLSAKLSKLQNSMRKTVKKR